MPGFLQRLRTARRPVSQTATPSAPTAQDNAARRQLESDDDYSDEVAPGRNRMPRLPDIKDNGSYIDLRYASETLYYNSTLIETGDEERLRMQSKAKDARSAAEASKRQNDPERAARRKKEAEDSYNRDVAKMTYLHAMAARQRELYESHGPGRHDHTRRVWGRERAGTDRIMTYNNPALARLPPLPVVESTRSPEPLTPGTREWDSFMDFDVDEPRFMSGIKPELPPRAPPPTPTSGPYFAIQQEKGLPELPFDYYENAYVAPDRYSPQVPALSPKSSHVQVLGQGTVKPEIKDTVQGQVNDTVVTNGIDMHDHASTSAVAVPIPTLTNVECDSNDIPTVNPPPAPLTNGIQNDTPSLDLRTSPSPSPPKPWHDSTPRDSDPGSRHSATDSTSNDTLYRMPSPSRTPAPRSTASQSLQSLLRTVLSPSELSLFNTTTITSNHPEVPSIVPVSTRLTHKTRTLIQHLHDHITYTDSVLLPSQGEALERKTFALDLLGLEAKQLGEQIRELHGVLDLGNRIVAGCWGREYEMWRTLAMVREKRTRGFGGFVRRVTGRGRGKGKVAEEARRLAKRELDAVLLMAAQNVQILREDADDMVERLEGVKRRHGSLRQSLVGEVEPGSWRDV